MDSQAGINDRKHDDVKAVDPYRLARIDALVVKLLIGISAGEM